MFLCIADCLPIIMYDPTNHVIALLHAARNSTNLNLASHVVKQLSDQFGTQPRDIWVAFGPTIRPESYLFPAEIINSLVSSEWQPYLSLQPDGRIAVDVAAFNKDQLIESGVPVSQIEDQGLNTRTDPHYFSHVRSQQDHLPEGRFAAVVALKP
ncbi:polyphenol oxidase family protein [bacterium]|nr:MAG: polyphenol oxidase family protein [bacterium]